MAGERDLVATTEAKEDYFLSSRDLSRLNFRSIQGRFGAPKRYYSAADLQATAIYKHGLLGYQRKIYLQQLRARMQSQEDSDRQQRLLQDKDDRALVELQQESRASATTLLSSLPRNPRCDKRIPVVKKMTIPRDAGATSVAVKSSAKDITVKCYKINSSSDDDVGIAWCALTEPVVDVSGPRPEQTTAELRQSLLKLAKKALCFTDRGVPQSWRVDVPGIQPSAFAALAGHPTAVKTDPALRLFMGEAAPVTAIGLSQRHLVQCHQLQSRELFGCAEADLLRVFHREGVGIQIADETVLKYDTPETTLTLLGEGQLVCDERTMWL
jgi:hypothetical protein